MIDRPWVQRPAIQAMSTNVALPQDIGLCVADTNIRTSAQSSNGGTNSQTNPSGSQTSDQSENSAIGTLPVSLIVVTLLLQLLFH